MRAFMNSNSAGLRGQKARVRLTVRSSLFFTVRIWPSWLVQNCSGLIGEPKTLAGGAFGLKRRTPLRNCKRGPERIDSPPHRMKRTPS